MKLIHTINSSEMTVSSVALNTLTSPVYGDVFGNVYGTGVTYSVVPTAAMFARLHYSWTGQTSAGAAQLICRAVMLPDDGTPTGTHYIWGHVCQTYANQFSNTQNSQTLIGSAVGGAAAGADWFDICWIGSPNTGGGPIIPLPPYWTWRFSTGTAFTAGTLTIDKVEFFG